MAQGAKAKKTTGRTASKRPSRAKARAPKTSTSTGKAKGLDLIRKISLTRHNSKIGEFRTGDTVSVYVKVKEGEKERLQVYKGVVTKIQGAGASKSFTVRKISSGIGVERTFPFLSPLIDRVEVQNIGHVRRSKLYYLRGLEGKAAKIESDLVVESAADSTATAEESSKA